VTDGAADPCLEVLSWTETGYQPLVFSAGWQVALLNWEPLFDLPNAGEIERHNQTDEVFVLMRGRAVLFVVTPDGLRVEDMLPGVVYNVRAGIWHNLVSTRDATWIIVENRDTHLHDCEFRQLSPEERVKLEASLPDWAR
jgi:mannose-6-phosphate isomerase-like protein (cupin superfamily)